MIREELGWSQTALKKHLDRLLEMEFIIPHRGSARRVEYELLYDGRGREGQPTMCGLIDVGSLPTSTTTAKASSPLKAESSPLVTEPSPQNHPENTQTSSPSKNGKPKESLALSR
jgi:hypothetical protein